MTGLLKQENTSDADIVCSAEYLALTEFIDQQLGDDEEGRHLLANLLMPIPTATTPPTPTPGSELENPFTVNVTTPLTASAATRRSALHTRNLNSRP